MMCSVGFAHRAFQAQQQAIIEQRWMVDAIAVANESIRYPNSFEQAYTSRHCFSQA